MSTIQELVDAMLKMPDEELQQQSHADLYTARAHAPKEEQDRLSKAEHRAFAREATAENPLLALPIAAGTLAYQPYKFLKGQARSSGSLDQVMQGLTGVGEGIKKALDI